jgi:hypothetical protein
VGLLGRDARQGPKATFTVKGAKRVGRGAGENRTIPLKDGRFEDEFKPYDVHLYRIR